MDDGSAASLFFSLQTVPLQRNEIKFSDGQRYFILTQAA
jgi:hypothetical protein